MICTVKYEDLLEFLDVDKNKDVEQVRIDYVKRIITFVIKDKSKWITATQTRT